MSCQAGDRSLNAKRLHFLLVPLLAQGHLIPMVDLAKLLAARGMLVTFATTPVNLARIQPTVASNLPIRFVELPFPAADFGLPDGCESADLIPTADLFIPFMNSLTHLRKPLEDHLRVPDPTGWPKPACLISDNLQHWTAEVATSLKIPRLIFHGPSCLFLFCDRFIKQHNAELEAAVDAAPNGSIMIPGLPHSIHIKRRDVISVLRSDPGWSKYVESIRVAEESANGVLVNSFVELEPWYFDKYHDSTGKPVWPIGPLSLHKEELEVKAERGRVSSVDNKVLFQWLDKQKPGSVVLVSFGSIARSTMAQLVELGHGLEATQRPFVWVVKEAAERKIPGVEEWMAEFEMRVEGRGVVIKGWAPQTVLLGHVAVGGFMTHCGWNSTLEAVAAGVVMATWPHFYDQFLNEQLVVDVLKIGVAVGVKEPRSFGVGDPYEEVVNVRSEEVERAVEKLMGGGEEGEERRERARELEKMARMAMEEDGSSWKGLQDVINYALEFQEYLQQKHIHLASPTMSCQAGDCRIKTKRLHFLLVPLLAQGHLIPMVDLAKLLAARGTLITFATTPINLARIQPTVASTLPIRFIQLRFPTADFGLPDGCESADLIPSADLFLPFMNALSHLREPLEDHLRVPDQDGWPKPSCLISDNLQHWTAEVATRLNIPRFIFHGPSCFFLFFDHFIKQHYVELVAAVETAPTGSIMIPSLPHPIHISKHEVLSAMRSDPDWSKYMKSIRVAEESADGVLVNSFVELESWYFDKYREATGKPVWPVGPLSLYEEELAVKAARGRVSSVDNKFLFQWLDRQKAGSVVLVSFGSIARNTMAQLVELGHGLEATHRPFVWVVKEAAEKKILGLDEWMEEFEKRVEGRGMVIKGWAPQAVLLGHIAVGGFVTHCGWNSTLEAVAAGVVIATWPNYYDQFLNAQLVVVVLRIGVEIGVKEPRLFGVGDDDEEAVKVRREEVERAVEKLMEGGEEGEERRKRVRELGKMGRMALEEGGCSWKGLQNVISYALERM
ncbi:uncharacterized protein LOC110019754 [Phalaenopsis equestris]|uniref:uncharacterized protein LOC110019754 n=1 Tax=Phalaenopsis equestris TaxID=78828 RepID=UPI0009E3325D|nr:uncharacterized protein LOC110019754 [Phalaenopsis equestris]